MKQRSQDRIRTCTSPGIHHIKLGPCYITPPDYMRMRNPLCWQLSFKLLVAVYLYFFLKGTTLCSQDRIRTCSCNIDPQAPLRVVRYYRCSLVCLPFHHLTIFNISNNFFLSYLQYTKSLSDLQIFFKFPFKTTCGFLFA